LIHFGYDIVYGSRNCNQKYIQECLQFEENFKKGTSVEVSSIGEAWHKSDCFVFMAVSPNVYDKIVNEIFAFDTEIINPKIVFDVSNFVQNNKNDKSILLSNTQKLEKLFEEKTKEKVNVVKGFNNLSAHTLENVFDQTTINLSLPIAGDDLATKLRAIDFCQRIGFQAFDFGPCATTIVLEKQNSTTFEEWKWPSIFVLIFFTFNYLWVLLIYYIFPKKPTDFSTYLNNLSILSHVNKVLGFTSLQLLAYVYLPSVFAAFYQLYYGTKYQRFPKYLDLWLKARKQIGLWAFLIASFHALFSIFIITPQYKKSWFKSFNSSFYVPPQMTVIGEFDMILGVIAYFIMVLVAISSINSISKSLNWKEWNFVQTKLGIACLTSGIKFNSKKLLFINYF
jgi:predicted dinucleotide-binding enzyme